MINLILDTPLDEPGNFLIPKMTNAVEIEEEQTHFTNVIATFRKYSQYSVLLAFHLMA
jgi:hypothetical protein